MSADGQAAEGTARRPGGIATSAARDRTAGSWLPPAAFAVLGLVAVVGVLAWALRRPLVTASPGQADSGADFWSGLLFVAVAGGCGAATVRQRPRHPVGWLLLGYALLGGLGVAAWQLALQRWYGAGGDRTAAVGWAGVQESLLRLQFGAVLLTLLLFPTGRPPSSRWNRLVPVTGFVFAGWALLHVLGAGVVREDPFMSQPNPWALPVTALRLARRAALPVAAVVAVLVLASLVERFRRSSGDERQQIRWVGLLAAGVPVALVALLVAIPLGFDAANVAGDTLVAVLQVGLPVAIVLAVTRHRLYDLDLVINRGAVYLAVTLVLLAVYAATVLLLTRVVVGVGWRSPGVVAAATFAAALALAPAHRRAQDLADRVFQRQAWAAARQIEAFAAASRSTGRPPAELRDVLAQVLGDPGLLLGLWIRHPEGWVGPDGLAMDVEQAAASRHRLPVDVAGAPVAVLLHDPALTRHQQLLSAVTDAARLLLENARLQAEGLAQLADIRASRSRIVEAGDAERRRVERDLHDGAQQRLVAVALRLKLAARAADEPDAAGLGELAAEVQAALGELRELARGLHPAALDEGLTAALESLTARSPVAVDIEVREPALSPDTRLTAYFVAAEAIANAVKHAGGPRIVVRGDVEREMFTLTVRDLGRGGARPAPGSGLAGLADRVAAVGGTLRIDSPPGAGTTIEARLPCVC